jgi:hypothetical protein
VVSAETLERVAIPLKNSEYHKMMVRIKSKPLGLLQIYRQIKHAVIKSTLSRTLLAGLLEVGLGDFVIKRVQSYGQGKRKYKPSSSGSQSTLEVVGYLGMIRVIFIYFQEGLLVNGSLNLDSYFLRFRSSYSCYETLCETFFASFCKSSRLTISDFYGIQELLVSVVDVSSTYVEKDATHHAVWLGVVSKIMGEALVLLSDDDKIPSDPVIHENRLYGLKIVGSFFFFFDIVLSRGI